MVSLTPINYDPRAQVQGKEQDGLTPVNYDPRVGAKEPQTILDPTKIERTKGFYNPELVSKLQSLDPGLYVAQHPIKATLRGAAMAAPFMVNPALGIGEKIGGGFLGSAADIVANNAVIGGVMGLSDFADKMLQGKSLKESTKAGVETGKMGAMFGASLSTAAKVIGKVGGGVLRAVSEKAEGLNTLQNLKQKANEVNLKLADMRSELDKRMFTSEKKVEERRVFANQQTWEMKSAIEVAQKTSKEHAQKAVSIINELEPAVKAQFKTDYDEILKVQGDQIIDLSPLTNQLKQLFDTGTKGEFVETLKAFAKGDKGMLSSLDAWLDRYALPLSDVHNIKMLIRDYSEYMFNQSLTKGIPMEIGQVASEMAGLIDAKVGGKYKEVGQRYGSWVNAKHDILNTGIGKQITSEGKKVAAKSQMAVDSVVSNLNQGKDITMQEIQQGNNDVRAIFESIYQFEKNGMPQKSKELMKHLVSMKDEIFNINKNEEALKFLDGMAKASPESLINKLPYRQEAIQMNDELRALKKQIYEHKYSTKEDIGAIEGIMKTSSQMGTGVIGWELSSFMPRELRMPMRASILLAGMMHKSPQEYYGAVKKLQNHFNKEIYSGKYHVKNNIVRAANVWFNSLNPEGGQ